MPTRRPNNRRPRVFINCPFDDDYGDMLRAIAFAIASCGFEPACALDDDDSGKIRFDKLKALIEVPISASTIFPASSLTTIRKRRASTCRSSLGCIWAPSISADAGSGANAAW